MSWIIYLPIGLVIGVMFSVAYPESAQGINDAVAPTVQSFSESALSKVKDMALTVLLN